MRKSVAEEAPDLRGSESVKGSTGGDAGSWERGEEGKKPGDAWWMLSVYWTHGLSGSLGRLNVTNKDVRGPR